MKLLFCVLFLAYTSFVVSTFAYAQITLLEEPTPPLGRIAPQTITAQPIHKISAEPKQRYQLSVEGKNLENASFQYSWSASCGYFYVEEKKFQGRYREYGANQVIWGYTLPREECTDPEIGVIIKDVESKDEVQIRQLILTNQARPTIVPYYLGITEKKNCTILDRASLSLSSLWNKFYILIGAKYHAVEEFRIPCAG